MNDTETEVALLAIAEALAWQDDGDRSVGTGGKSAYSVWALYMPDELATIESVAVGYQAVIVLPHGLFGGDCLHHDTREDAKACCERHHATGKWEY